MLIDTHIHLFQLEYGVFSFPAPSSEFYRNLTSKEVYEESGKMISSMVLVGCDNAKELNVLLLRDAAKDPLIGAYIGCVDLSDPDCGFYIREYEAMDKYRGYRVSVTTGFPYKEKIAKYYSSGTIIELIGYWQDMTLWVDFIAAHPEITFVIEHFGIYFFNGEAVPKEYKDFCKKMAALENVFIKLSGMYSLYTVQGKPFKPENFKDAYFAAYEAFGADRCMFGSDWPVCKTPYEEIMQMTRLLLDSEENCEKVLYSTAKKLYRIV